MPTSCSPSSPETYSFFFVMMIGLINWGFEVQVIGINWDVGRSLVHVTGASWVFATVTFKISSHTRCKEKQMGADKEWIPLEKEIYSQLLNGEFLVQAHGGLAGSYEAGYWCNQAENQRPGATWAAFFDGTHLHPETCTTTRNRMKNKAWTRDNSEWCLSS